VPRSPVSLAKANAMATMDSKHPSYVSLSQAGFATRAPSQADPSSPYMGATSMNSSQILPGSLLASPLATATKDAPWPGEAGRDLHLSGSEPRYFPGVVTRRQRTDSVRQNSLHESDRESNSGTLKRTVTRGEDPSESTN
jgi:AMP deaminase